MLLLFDIDGTLLQGVTPLVGQAMSAALKEVHGVDTGAIRTQIATAGRTDGDAVELRLVLRALGLGPSRNPEGPRRNRGNPKESRHAE